MDSDKKAFIGGVVAGALAGAITALLLAPKAGREMREDFKGHLGDIKDNLVGKLGALGEVSRNKYDEIVSAVVAEYEAAEKLTKDEAEAIKVRLCEGYEGLREQLKDRVQGE